MTIITFTFYYTADKLESRKIIFSQGKVRENLNFKMQSLLTSMEPLFMATPFVPEKGLFKGVATFQGLKSKFARLNLHE